MALIETLVGIVTVVIIVWLVFIFLMKREKRKTAKALKKDSQDPDFLLSGKKEVKVDAKRKTETELEEEIATLRRGIADARREETREVPGYNGEKTRRDRNYEPRRREQYIERGKSNIETPTEPEEQRDLSLSSVDDYGEDEKRVKLDW